MEWVSLVSLFSLVLESWTLRGGRGGLGSWVGRVATYCIFGFGTRGTRAAAHSRILKSSFVLSRSAGPRDARVAGYSSSYIETISVDERVNKATVMSGGTSIDWIKR